MWSVLIADDHEVVRRGIRDIADAHGWRICAEATNGLQAVALAAEHTPDLAILDILMPEKSGLQAIREIKIASPDTRLLVLTGNPSERDVREAALAGAHGYVLKSETSKMLVDAAQVVMRGEAFFPKHGAAAPVPTPVPCDPASQLTYREREVLALLAKGKRNAAIASLLGVSVRTIEAHRFNIMEKLELQSFADLVVFAIRNGIVEP